jgi:hypothetical protein
VKPLTHTQRLIELIRTLHDAQTTWNPQSNGDGPRLMPTMWTQGSYAELEHQLRNLRDNPETRTAWWHTSHRYRWGTTRKTTVPIRRTRQGPVPRLPANTELVSAGTIDGHHQHVVVYQWRLDVNQAHVNNGIDVLLERMHNGQPHMIRIPHDIYCHAAGIPINEPRELATA